MQYKIQDIEIGVTKNITGKDGKPYQLLPLSFKLDGWWRKGALFGKEMILADELSIGDMIDVELSEKTYLNKAGEEKSERNFKIIGMSQSSGIPNRVKELEQKVAKLEKQFTELYENSTQGIPLSKEAWTEAKPTECKNSKPVKKAIVESDDNSDLPF